MIWLPSVKRPQVSLEPRAPASHPSRHLNRQRLYQSATMAFCLRNDRDDAVLMEREGVLCKEVILDLGYTPPFGLCFDLLGLWHRGPQFSSRPFPTHEPMYGRLMLRIQNEILYPLLRSERFQQLHRLLLSLSTNREIPSKDSPLTLSEKARIFLTVASLRPLTHLFLGSFRPHPVFPKDSKPEEAKWLVCPTEALSLWEQEIQYDSWTFEHMSSVVDGWQKLSTDEQTPASSIPILRHFTLLPTKLHRLAWERLHQCTESIPPHRSELSFHFNKKEAASTDLPTQDASPKGGYTGITNRGEPQNLLPSELLFWEDNVDPNFLFLRWLEGDTLFFQREKDLSLTPRRRLFFVFDLEPGELQYKPTRLPLSGEALIFGLLSRLCIDLNGFWQRTLTQFHFVVREQKYWKKRGDILQLFLSQLPSIGAYTHWSCRSLKEKLVGKRNRQKGDIYVGISSLSRYSPEHDFDFSLVVAPFFEKGDSLPPFALPFEEQSESFEELSLLRDRMVESILRSCFGPSSTQ